MSGSRWRAILLLLALIVIAIGAAVLGIAPRLKARTALAEQTDYLAAPTVSVVHPRFSAPAEEVALPGNIQAFVDAPIYARTNGYLKRWYFDIGAHVRTGQVLAEIESPEVDQELQQTEQDLASAQDNLKLAQITASRYTDLFKTDSVAKQDVDNAVQNEAARSAAVQSSAANVRRLQELVSFEKIVAPFDGVVTARNTDIGQLIQSGPANASGRELFHVAAVDRLRVFVNVPQQYSHEAVKGVKAELTLPEMPGRRFSGVITRTADALDPATRTLLVEVDVPNREGLLLPNSYTQVHLKVSSKTPSLLVPATALVFRAEGLRAATVSQDRASLVPVTAGRDFGTDVEVVAGLSSDSSVIVNPPDSLVNGEQVRVVAQAHADRN